MKKEFSRNTSSTPQCDIRGLREDGVILKKLMLLLMILLLAAPGTFLLAQGGGDQKVEDLVSLIKLRSGLEIRLPGDGWKWSEQSIQGTQDSGQAVFSRNKWLMYLIHWGPIQTKEISVSYVRDRMLKMWGVNFEFTGTEGTTQIAKHPAVYVEAYGTNRGFYTRFVVWNCPETGREFIADMNYNLVSRTPRNDFEAELRSARTVCCHKGAHKENYLDLTSRWESTKYGFSFDYPERWFFFDSPFYVPFPQYEGVRGKDFGSILGLCSDQNEEITLIWGPTQKSEGEVPMFGADQAIRKQLLASLASVKSLVSFKEERSETFQIGNRKITCLLGVCVFKEPEQENERNFLGQRGIFEAARWDMPEKNKSVTVIMLTREYQYLHHFSTPKHDALNRFLQEFVLQCK